MPSIKIAHVHLESDDSFGEWWDKQNQKTSAALTQAAGLSNDLANCCWDGLTAQEQQALYETARSQNGL